MVQRYLSQWILLILVKNFLPGKQILFLKSSPQLPSDTVSTLVAKSKINFFNHKKVRQIKSSGKSQGVLKWKISGSVVI